MWISLTMEKSRLDKKENDTTIVNEVKIVENTGI